jgi:hypothetical protein
MHIISERASPIAIRTDCAQLADVGRGNHWLRAIARSLFRGRQTAKDQRDVAVSSEMEVLVFIPISKVA